jgi:phospholipase/carboxylesterase
VFPDGPQRTRPPDGPVDGRAWWPLELAAYVPRGGTLPDLSASSPPGIVEAAALVHELIDHLPPRSRTPLVLGGFSQGAMVAAQLAFTSDDPVDALVLLSPTIVDERSWERAFASRRGLPVFVSHGRRDDVLPFDVTDRLRSKLARAGLEVTWCPFDGGHEIPAEVVVALNGFLQQRLRGDVTQPSGRRR